MGRASRRKRVGSWPAEVVRRSPQTAPRSPDDPHVWTVDAPRTGLWRTQWRFTLFLYGLAALGMVATVVGTVLGETLWPTALWADAGRSPWLRWVGENWSWFRLFPAGVAVGILLALHRPRRATLVLADGELRLVQGRAVRRIALTGAGVAWERWPGYPAHAARAFLRLEDGPTTLRIGLPDTPAGPGLPVAPTRHAAPDLVLRARPFGELRAALRANGLVVDPVDALAGAAAQDAPGAAGVGRGGPLGRALRRIPLALRLLVVVVVLATAAGLGLARLAEAGHLPEEILPLFSLVVLGVWAAIGIRLRNR